MSKNTRNKEVALAVLALFAYFICIILDLRGMGSDFASGVCKIGASFDCNKVTQSSYSQFFGLSLARWGLIFYGFLILSACYNLYRKDLNSSIPKLYFLSGLVASIFSVYLFIVSKFIIGAFCPFCIALYLINISILLIYIKFWKQTFAELIRQFQLRFFIQLFISACLAFSFPILLAAVQQDAKDVSWPITGSLDLDYNFDNSIKGDYYLGNKSAKIQIVEFSDIECPFCRRVSGVFEDLSKKYPDQLLFIFKNFPLDKNCNNKMEYQIHQNACLAAEAARCVGEQGAFWPYLHDLFNLELLEAPNLSTNAVRAGLEMRVKMLNLDQDAYKECLKSGRQKIAILKDLAEGHKLKINGTPSIWINGKLLEKVSEERIEEIVDELVKRQGEKNANK